MRVSLIPNHLAEEIFLWAVVSLAYKMFDLYTYLFVTNPSFKIGC